METKCQIYRSVSVPLNVERSFNLIIELSLYIGKGTNKDKDKNSLVIMRESEACARLRIHLDDTRIAEGGIFFI